MPFMRYPDIENHYREKYIARFLTQYPELLTVDYHISEKLHGCNFQVYFEPYVIWQYGKRSSFLAPGTKFYDVWQVTEQYVPLFKCIQRVVDAESRSVRLFGEMFGPGIQKGVDYGSKEKRILFYDLMVDGQFLPPCKFFHHPDLIEHTVPVVAVVHGLHAALEYDVKFDTLLNPNDDNVCEGVVIRPYRKVYYSHQGSRFCLKKKNPEFMERAKEAKPKRSVNPVLAQLNREFRTYITDNRLQSIFSQHGEIEEPKQIGAYIKLVLDDAKKDFLKDVLEDVAGLTKGAQRQVYNVGSIIALMLKKYL